MAMPLNQPCQLNRITNLLAHKIVQKNDLCMGINHAVVTLLYYVHSFLWLIYEIVSIQCQFIYQKEKTAYNSIRGGLYSFKILVVTYLQPKLPVLISDVSGTLNRLKTPFTLTCDELHQKLDKRDKLIENYEFLFI